MCVVSRNARARKCPEALAHQPISRSLAESEHSVAAQAQSSEPQPAGLQSPLNLPIPPLAAQRTFVKLQCDKDDKNYLKETHRFIRSLKENHVNEIDCFWVFVCLVFVVFVFQKAKE